MCTCSAFDTGWVKEAIAQWGGGGGEKGEEAKERQEEEQAKQEICQGREKLQDPVTREKAEDFFWLREANWKS